MIEHLRLVIDQRLVGPRGGSATSKRLIEGIRRFVDASYVAPWFHIRIVIPSELDGREA